VRVKGLPFRGEVMDTVGDILFRIEHLVIVVDGWGTASWELKLIYSFFQVS